MGEVDGPRWLDPDELYTWFTFGTMFTWLPDALDGQLQRDAGMTFFEYQVLSMLSVSWRGRRRMSELAELANGSLPRLSRAVDRLDRRGWVTRAPDPDNGRYTLAVLTEAGWDKVTTTAPGHVAEVRRLVFDPLTTTQVDQLREIATRIRDVVRPGAEPPPFPLPDERPGE